MVFELLGTGAENAKSSRELCGLLGINHRVLTQAIEAERRAGQPICASCDSTNPGYFLAATRAEMEKYCSRLRHRAGEIFKTRKACLDTLDNLPEGTA